MTSPWDLKPLGDVCKLKSGFAFKSSQWTDVGVPVIQIGNVRDGCLDTTSLKRVSQESAKAASRFAVSQGDLLVGMTGYVGAVSVVGADQQGWLVNQRVGMVSEVDSSVDRKFLGYVLRSPAVASRMKGLARGSAQPNLSSVDFGTIEVLFPPLDEQRRIAGVLGALDDLIEVNRGLIADLLATADAMAATPIDEVSEVTFADVCDIFGGGTPSTRENSYWGREIRWATPTDITALQSPYLFDTSRRITTAGLDACASKLMPKGSILMTSRATIGAFAIAQESTAVNQGFIAVEPRSEVDRWFLFHEMRRRVPEFIQRANGSTFLELSRGVFKSLAVAWPSLEARTELFHRLDPLHSAAASLQAEIHELEATRDDLLPLLMSGRVRVSEAVVA